MEHAAPRDHQLGLLERLKVKDLLEARPKQTVIELPAEAKPFQNFQVLVRNHILSAPVVTKDEKYIGFLDIRDFVASVIFADKVDKDQAKIEEAEEMLSRPIFDPDRMTAALEVYVHKFDTRAVEDPARSLSTSYLCSRHKFVEVRPEDSMKSLFDLLLEFDVRKVAVRTKGYGKILGIISQADIIRYLHTHASKFPALFEKKVSELKLGSSPVITCQATDTVASAFEVMERKKIGGLAVMQDGEIVTNVSASDIKLFLGCESHTPTAALLKSPVLEFVSRVRQKAENVNIGFPYVSVTSDSTLAHVIAKLAVTRFHHLYVKDATGALKAVISLRDCIRVARPWVSMSSQLDTPPVVA